ncbi:MAG TPA: MMPL family transporter [Chitinophagales bacterium]|nr:MMPL family transporter [Chitinophagales bacterium]HRG26490.1 MMPL family transporter [Chitinophagales bacterium]HRG84934.1 MMPL family transporter [Chitinophagales bacterium]HRH53126.1 MMPL family transporter [Chitinophagales bacterium]
MTYETTRVKLSYEFYKTVPEDNAAYQDYEDFKAIFGEEGNVLFLGIQSERFFELDYFNDWCALEKSIKEIEDVESTLSVPSTYNLVKNISERRFDIQPLVVEQPKTQAELDSIKNDFLRLPFYKDRIYSPDSNTYVMLIAIDREVLNSPRRISLINELKEKTEAFGAEHQTDIKYSGLPYIRYYQLSTITREVKLFLILAVIITIIVLYILFRSWDAVVFPLLIIGSGVVISTGFMALLGYEFTVLTSLVPSLLIVMGIPNCVYLLNKYHHEVRRNGNKIKSLSLTVEKLGFATFITNMTKAVGFVVFCFTNVRILEEFGLIATIGVLATFIISLVGIPVVYSFLPRPKAKQTEYLESKQLKFILGKLELWTSNHRRQIFISAIIIIIISTFGASRLKSKGYILDEVKETTEVYQDMKFFERVFHGVMPFEVMVTKKQVVTFVQDTIINEHISVVDTDTIINYDTLIVKRPDTSGTSVMGMNTLQKIAQLQDTLATYPQLSTSLSILDGLKFARQAYYNGSQRYYSLPNFNNLTTNDLKVKDYLENSGQKGVLENRFVDSKGEIARISVQVADIGSDSMPKLMADIQPKIDAIFDKENYDVRVTGTSIVALSGYQYLIDGLFESLLIALIVISLILLYQFRSLRMLAISFLPNLIPLFITGAIMGFLNIAIKPSTVLIFSIAYGMCVDFTCYFVAKYKHDLIRNSFNIPKTVMSSLQEAGVSMIYTSLILFCGFFIFVFSKFGGTVNMGLLTSITLLVALFNNLLLLPALILLFEKGLNKSNSKLRARAAEKANRPFTDLINNDTKDIK